LRHGALARATDRDPQASRADRRDARTDLGKLRRHRGRLHRLSRTVAGGEPGSGRADRKAAANPLPVLRLRDGRLESATPAEPAARRPAVELPLLGYSARSDPARARVLAPA